MQHENEPDKRTPEPHPHAIVRYPSGVVNPTLTAIVNHMLDKRKRIPIKYYEEIGPGMIVNHSTAATDTLRMIVNEGGRSFVVHIWE